MDSAIAPYYTIDNYTCSLSMNFRCGCRMGHGKKPCSQQFDSTFIMNRRLDMIGMIPSKSSSFLLIVGCAKHCFISGEQDLVLLGLISGGIVMTETTACSKRKDQKTRERQRTHYTVEAKPVCRKTFLFLHA